MKIRRLSLLYLFSFCEQKADSFSKAIHPVLFNFGDGQDISLFVILNVKMFVVRNLF